MLQGMYTKIVAEWGDSSLEWDPEVISQVQDAADSAKSSIGLAAFLEEYAKHEDASAPEPRKRMVEIQTFCDKNEIYVPCINYSVCITHLLSALSVLLHWIVFQW